MWKESYRIGVDLIDKQHIELFKMVGHLIDVVQKDKINKKAECISAISYMKDYTLKHFKDEEDYQISIGYSGFAEHKNIHRKFVQVVLNHEQKMLQSDFDEKHIKDFMGVLIAWLVYHVAGADQQITANKEREEILMRQAPIDGYFSVSICDTLKKLTGKDIISRQSAMHTIDDLQSAIVVIMNLSGSALGKITFKYTKQLAFELMKSMAGFTPKSIDEIVCSAMSEISNIISVKAVGMMSEHGFSCSINNPVIQVHPMFLTSKEGIIFNTDIGILEMTLSAA